MKKYNKFISKIFILLLIITISMALSACNNNTTKTQETYNIDDFTKEMKAKGYNSKLKDVKSDFLPTERKIIKVNDELIQIYLYKDNNSMEKDAARIDEMGCSYTKKGLFSDKSIKVSWVSYPHFYKKGKIIVLYVGEDDKIISDLESLLGQQFAGYRGN